ncbi:PREDICTED: uncharacterized protein LOC109472934 [Branchiostoma belcheri]|uniref:Uncharacterized protein LOC109472934 n=1 Tax=Branchiostoma belcheri TaxID=7741 RepID=A0A6P4Z344_BRABE|nr:PREDICTED: uncharacterized protein LOC109472934 [Branchiostoma belcheri]
MPRELKCYPKQDGGLVSEDVLQNLSDSAILEIYTFSTAKTTDMAAIVGAGIQPETSPKDREVFTLAVIMSCAFGGLMFLCVVIIAAWVYNKRKASQRTSQLQETGTSLTGDDNAPQQETSLPILLPEYSSQSIDTGFTSETDPTPSAVGVGLPVQVSSIHPNLQEPNFNPRVPIMVSLKTTTPQHAVSQNAALGNRGKKQTSPKVAATPDRILHLNEETSPKDEVKAIKRCGCEPASSLTYVGRATRPKSVANARKREDVRSSVSLDESTPSEPHTLCSSLPDSVSCPELDEMISGKSTT